MSMARSPECSLEEEEPLLLEKEPIEDPESQVAPPQKKRSYLAGYDAKPWSQEVKDVRKGQSLQTHVKRNWNYFVLACIVIGATVLFGFFLAGKLHQSRFSEIQY